MTLAADEFMRRFLLHAVPDGFHRIRHLGLPVPSESYRERHHRLTGHALDICPECGGPMRERGPLPRRPPRRPFWCDSS